MIGSITYRVRAPQGPKGNFMGRCVECQEKQFGGVGSQHKLLYLLCGSLGLWWPHRPAWGPGNSRVQNLPSFVWQITTCVSPGALPGTAEQGPGHQVDPAPGAGHKDREAEPGAPLRAVHQQPQETAGQHRRGARTPGLGAEEHAGPGGGLQEQVS